MVELKTIPKVFKTFVVLDTVSFPSGPVAQGQSSRLITDRF